jgi:hypothetical protein
MLSFPELSPDSPAPTGEREGPNAKHCEDEGEQTAKFPFSDQAHSAGSPSPYLSPDGERDFVCIR